MTPPDSAQELTELAAQLLDQSGAIGVYPTPVGRIVKAAGLINRHDDALAVVVFEDISDQTRSALPTLLAKSRGIVSHRSGEIHLSPSLHTDEQRRFVTLHEVAHYVIPWHRDLAGECKEAAFLDKATHTLFENEANFLAGELLFQCSRHGDLMSSRYKANEAIFDAARKYGASLTATHRRVIETSRYSAFGMAIGPLPDRLGEPVVYRLRHTTVGTVEPDRWPVVGRTVTSRRFPFLVDLAKESMHERQRRRRGPHHTSLLGTGAAAPHVAAIFTKYGTLVTLTGS